ncbi:MAG: alcohol dehydrogenase catalytic domain-containing protein [Rectinemataceae bacterium]|jgi:D-arabinose 1-dehydrogenase-like Zn-dependent alcohol dehydrogenase
MATMKAAVFEKPGVIAIRQVPVPEIGDDEVLIKIKYTGICGTDWSIYTGKYSSDRLPLIAGHEFSGVIEKLGKNARDLEVGDRVTADILPSQEYRLHFLLRRMTARVWDLL